jgi:hypothetical protein
MISDAIVGVGWFVVSRRTAAPSALTVTSSTCPDDPREHARDPPADERGEDEQPHVL